MGVIFNVVQLLLLCLAAPSSHLAVAETTTFPIYKQEEAIRAAKSREVLQYMNLSVNPCEDFYEYACGNWPKFHAPPVGKEDSGQTIKTILEEKIEEDLHNLLDENVTLEDSSAARRVKVFYKSCLEARQGEPSHQAFLSDFIKSNGGFPAIPGSSWLAHHHNYDWQHVVAILRYHYGLSVLIGMEVDNNYQTMEENSLYLQEPSTMMPRSLCNARTAQQIDVTDKTYDWVEQEVADNLRLWLSMKKEDALHVAADMVTFEHDLCKAMYMNSSSQDEEEEFIGSLKPENRTREYPRKSLNHFTQQFNNTLDFNAIVSNSFGVGVTKPVFMKSPKYFEQLIQVIEETEEYNKTVVANYIMYRALTYFNFPLNDTPRNRPAYCLQVVKKYFPKVLGDIYYRKYANTLDQHKLARVFEQLKKIMEESLNQEWIEEGTRRLGKKRLSKMSLQFPSYEKFTLNLEFVRNDFWKNLRMIMGEVRAHEVNRLFSAEKPMPKDEVQAYETRMVYRPYHQRIDIGWGVLQAPYYQAALPHGMRYAMIGQKLGQTLATAFDDLGWTADNPDHKVWDSHTAVEYYKNANCFTEQIGNYLHNDPYSYHNATKIRRLIAQSVGLNVAFNAYLDWLFYKNPSNDNEMLSKETLPELDFTNTQLFFIGFAQAHCESRKKPKKLDPLKHHRISPYSKHCLSRYQVNGPLANFIEFGREFHCPIGSEMNVADKCVIY